MDFNSASSLVNTWLLFSWMIVLLWWPIFSEPHLSMAHDCCDRKEPFVMHFMNNNQQVGTFGLIFYLFSFRGNWRRDYLSITKTFWSWPNFQYTDFFNVHVFAQIRIYTVIIKLKIPILSYDWFACYPNYKHDYLLVTFSLLNILGVFRRRWCGSLVPIRLVVVSAAAPGLTAACTLLKSKHRLEVWLDPWSNCKRVFSEILTIFGKLNLLWSTTLFLSDSSNRCKT